MPDVSLTAPIEPHQLDRKMRHGMNDLVARIAAQAAVQGRGHELLLRIYMAGLYHGMTLGERLDKLHISCSEGPKK